MTSGHESFGLAMIPRRPARRPTKHNLTSEESADHPRTLFKWAFIEN